MKISYTPCEEDWICENRWNNETRCWYLGRLTIDLGSLHNDMHVYAHYPKRTTEPGIGFENMTPDKLVVKQL